MKSDNTLLTKALADITKIFGEGSVVMAQDIKSLGSFSTGSVQLDCALGGGFPIGRITEIYGPEGSGKSTSCIHAIAHCQAMGGKAVYIDLEGTFDKLYARSLGVVLADLPVITPTNGEAAISMGEMLCKTGAIDLLIVDSIAVMLPSKVEEGEVSDANMSYHAKLVSAWAKRITPILYKHKICVIAINQIREKPGVAFGNPEYVTGGNALKYYASVRIDIRKSGTVHKDKEDVIIGEPRKIKIIKCKISSSQNKTMMVDIFYGEGIDQSGEVLDVCVDQLKLVEKTGSWYSWNGAKIAQGRDNARQFLKDNPEVFEELKEKVIEHLMVERFEDLI